MLPSGPGLLLTVNLNIVGLIAPSETLFAPPMDPWDKELELNRNMALADQTFRFPKGDRIGK
jgi:hypothetical protein